MNHLTFLQQPAPSLPIVLVLSALAGELSTLAFGFRASDFFRISDFGFRIWLGLGPSGFGA